MQKGSAPGARAAGSANPTSGHSPMPHSGIAKTVPSVTMRTCSNQIVIIRGCARLFQVNMGCYRAVCRLLCCACRWDEHCMLLLCTPAYLLNKQLRDWGASQHLCLRHAPTMQIS